MSRSTQHLPIDHTRSRVRTAAFLAALSAICLLATAAVAQEDYGDAPDGIPSCQATIGCASPPTLYPTLQGSANAPPGRNAPHHSNVDPMAIPFLGTAPTVESTAFQPCCDWISGGCDMDDGPSVLCLGGGCTSGVVVWGGGPCLERALGTFGPFPGSPTMGYWIFDVSTAPFAGQPNSYFVNVAVDWDLSTAFGDAALEWPLVDAPVTIGPWQTQTMTTPPFPVITTIPPGPPSGSWNVLPFWSRFTVSEQPIAPDFPSSLWDGSGPLTGFLTGETEDWVVLGDPGVPTDHGIPPGIDLFTTPGCGATYQDFSGMPIPPGFFDPGSDPFVGVVVLSGTPLATNPPDVFDPTDTIVRRNGPISLPGPGSPETIPIEIVALSLTSCEPIRVTYFGGQNPEFWDLKVGLSSMTPQPQGTMTVRCDPCGCAQGGTFTSELPVLPRLIFTRRSDLAVRNLDFGQHGLPPILFETANGHWLTFDPGLGLVKERNAFVRVDHDADPSTPERFLQFGTSKFHPGVRAVQCHQSACFEPVTFQKRLTTGQAQLAAHGVLPAQTCAGSRCPDGDDDGIPDDADNCPAQPNPRQEDDDDDGVGDPCDNLPHVYNPCQDDVNSVPESATSSPRLMLGAPSPNPASGTVHYEITLPVAGDARVHVFDVTGHLVRTVLDARLEAGRHGFSWNPGPGRHDRLAAGVYVLRLEALGRRETRTFVIQR